MNTAILGAQLYTLRQFTQTSKEFAHTLQKVKKIGYPAVQLSALGPIPVTEIKRIIDQEGLVVAATHVSFEKLCTETEAMIAEHQFLNCKHIAIGSLPQIYQNPAGYLEFAHLASTVARRLAAAGLTFSYHNHSFELERFGARTGLDILVAESAPEVFNFEIDTYWIQHGGGDPADWIRKVAGRIPLVHLKDMTIVNREQVMAEVGAGNLNWPEILRACRAAGVQWYLVEQDTCARDPFESLAISFENLKQMA